MKPVWQAIADANEHTHLGMVRSSLARLFISGHLSGGSRIDTVMNTVEEDMRPSCNSIQTAVQLEVPAELETIRTGMVASPDTGSKSA